MPRNARIDIPGILQHVMVRGIEKCTIFLDDEDRKFLLSRLSFLLKETDTDCLAWALMPNHFHLLVRPRYGKLSTLMRRLLTSYALYFNKRNNRVGHLFQNRYKSIICEEEAYLLQLVRYIHLNPLRAGIVKNMEELASYPWTGHAVLMGKRTMAGQQIDEILLHFDDQTHISRHRYLDFITEGLAPETHNNTEHAETEESKQKQPTDWKSFCKSIQLPAVKNNHNLNFSNDIRIMGSDSFAQSILKQESGESDGKPANTQVTIPALLTAVSKYFNIQENSLTLKTRARQVSIARGVFCYLSVRDHGYTAAEIARQLHLSRSGVCLAIRRGEKILAKSPEIRKTLHLNLLN